MPLEDIRRYKSELRARFKEVRAAMPPEKKAQKDQAILKCALSLPEYKNCRTLLCYVSTDREIDTKKLITQAISDGKTVAVPYCIDGTRNMDFYRISSIDDLVPRTFGVLEPVPEKSGRIEEFSSAVCVLPGLAYDLMGFRLGYGGGYYDRFLSREFTGRTIGLCYSECTLARIRHGRFDVACDLLVTDLFLKRMKKTRSPFTGASDRR